MEVLKEISVNSRVRVLEQGGWPSSPVGTVVYGPTEKIQTSSGIDWFYCVKFDEPTHDTSPDGPYIMSEVLSQDLVEIGSV